MAERSYIKGDRPVPDYRLVKFLGKGGFGEVWQATGPGGIEVALKIIPLDNKQGFKEFRAIRMVKNVRNAHLVPIIGFWLKDSNGNLFDDTAETDSFIIKGKATELIIAMGLGEKSLMDRLEECQKEAKAGIPSEELLDYMVAVAKAIDFLNRPIHNSGSGQIAIQHCDVKPQNIMLVGGEAQLCDFGLARVLGDPRTTQSGNMMMSVPYTSPEMFEASKPSHSSDQYALAVTYYELRTGELPFENPGNPASMMYQIMQGKLDLSRLTDPGERNIIKRATSLDPDKRYPTSLEMVRDLSRVITGAVTPPSSKPTGPRLPPGPEAEGTEIVPGYKLVRRLGQGGYGTVWEAQAPGGKRVAIKIIHDVQGSSGRQEFRALELIKSLDHEHLLDLHAYWLKDKDGEVIPDEVRNQPDAPQASTLVIATKLASKNLLQRLNECQREGHPGIPVTELLSYMRQAAQAIDFLNEPRHRFGDQVMSIQHRDIKPENILLVGRTAKVGDFGLAKVLEGTNAQIHGSSTGYTPHYAAPELFRGNVTRWTDQYSLAVTYFKLRTGRLPFDAAISLGDLLMMHLQGSLDLSALLESERTIIARATSPEASQRYPTCLDMVNALERCLTGEVRMPKPPLSATEPEIAVPSPKPAAPSKRPKPPSTPDGLTIRPEDEEGAVVVTAPGREEPAPGGAVVDWPVETREPQHDTPVPAAASAAVPDWRGGVGQKEAPAKATASARPSSTPELGLPNWRASQRRQRKVPAALLATAVLIVGGGATAFSVSYFLRNQPPPVEHPNTEADVARHIADKRFAEALAGIDAGRLDTDKKKDLRGQVLTAWLQEVQGYLAQSNFEAALAQAREILAHFPDSTKAAEIAGRARAGIHPVHPTPRDTRPTKTPEQVALDLLAPALNTLKTDAAKALGLFDQVAGMPVSDNLKARAKLGQARAYFRLGKPTEAGAALPSVPLGGKDEAIQSALRPWLRAPTGINKDIDPALLKTLLTDLQQLKSHKDLLAGEPEGEWVAALETQVKPDLVEYIAKTVDEAPRKDRDELLKAFGQLKVIAGFYPEYQKDLTEKRRLAVQKLWQAPQTAKKLRNAFKPPWARDDLAVVLKTLQSAKAILDLEPRLDADPPLLRELALASWYSEQPEGVWKLLETQPNRGRVSDVPYLLVKARSQPRTTKGLRTALEVYEGILSLYADLLKTAKEEDFPVTDVWDYVVIPAETVGEEVVRGSGQDVVSRFWLGHCYFIKAMLVDKYRRLDRWSDWQREQMASYEKAARCWPQPAEQTELGKTLGKWVADLPAKPEVQFQLSQLHLLYALRRSGEEQKQYLDLALADLGNGPPDHPHPELVYRERGLIHEFIAWSVPAPAKEKEYEQAIADYRQAFARDGNNYQYEVDQGRCHVKRAFQTREPAAVEAAEKALQDALATGHLRKDQYNLASEDHYFLGLLYLVLTAPADDAKARDEFTRCLESANTKKNPEPLELLELADNKDGIRFIQREAFGALEAIATRRWQPLEKNLMSLGDKATEKERQQLRPEIEFVASCYRAICRFAPDFAPARTASETVAVSRLVLAGSNAYAKGILGTKAAFGLLDKSLPADPGQLEPVYLNLLNWRNTLALKSWEEAGEGQGLVKLAKLAADAKGAVTLAAKYQNPDRQIQLCKAYYNDAWCCVFTKDARAGLASIEQALNNAPSPAEKKNCEQIREKLNSLK
jgi:serine/threonine protein kinase